MEKMVLWSVGSTQFFFHLTENEMEFFELYTVDYESDGIIESTLRQNFG